VVEAAGGHYLDLSIPSYPSEVRSRSGVFLVSGHRLAFEVGRGWLDRIGRRTTHVGDTPAAAFISEMAVLLAYVPMAVGLLQGLRVCEHHQISSKWFTDTVLGLYPFHIRSLLERVEEEPDPLARHVEASIDEWGRSAAEYGDYLRELGLDAGIYDAVHRLFLAASEAGHGDADWTGVAHLAQTR
jgi:3-hydroxyisobutyrate dehydrogenase-like beta-hydroxyacid dehydrogenase